MSEYRAALESLWANPWEPQGGPLAKWLTARRSAVELCLSSVPPKQLAELLGLSYQTLSQWISKNNVAHADGRSTRPIPGLVRPPAAADVKPPADAHESPAEAEEIGNFSGKKEGDSVSPAGQDLTPPAPPPAPAAQPPPRSIECWQAYVEGMKDALRLIFGVVEKGG